MSPLFEICLRAGRAMQRLRQVRRAMQRLRQVRRRSPLLLALPPSTAHFRPRPAMLPRLKRFFASRRFFASALHGATAR